MQTIVSIFKYLADTNTINFIIMAAILYAIIKKMNIGESLNKSVINTEKTIKQSETEKNKAKKQAQKAKKGLDNLPVEIKEIEKFSKQKSKIFEKQLNDSCNKNIERIKQNIDKVIAIEEKKISNEVQCQTISDSIKNAEASIIKMLEDNPHMHYEFIEESLQEIDRIEI